MPPSPPSLNPEADEGERCCLTVDGLPSDATVREVRVLFSGCEGYVDTQLTKEDNPRRALVRFSTAAHARGALDSRTGSSWVVGDEPVTLSLGVPTAGPLSPPSTPPICWREPLPIWTPQKSTSPVQSRIHSPPRSPLPKPPLVRKSALAQPRSPTGAVAKEALRVACETRNLSGLEAAIRFAYQSDLEDIYIVEARELLAALRQKIGVRFAAAEIARARLRLLQSWSSVDTALDGSNRLDTLLAAGCSAIEAIKFGKSVGGLSDTLTDLESMVKEHCRRWASFLLDAVMVSAARRDKDGVRTVIAEAEAAYRKLGGRSEFKECIIHGKRVFGTEEARLDAEAALEAAIAKRQTSAVRAALRDARRCDVPPETIKAAVDWLMGAKERTTARWGLVTVLAWSRQVIPEVLLAGAEFLERACQHAKDLGVEDSELENIHVKVTYLQQKRKVQGEMIAAVTARDPVLLQRALAAAKLFESEDDEAMSVLLERVTTTLKEEADKLNARIAKKKEAKASERAVQKETKKIAHKVQMFAQHHRKTAILGEMPELLKQAEERGVSGEQLEAGKSALKVAQAKQHLQESLQSEEVAAVKLAIAEGEQLGLSPFLLAPAVRRVAELDLLAEIDKALESLDVRASGHFIYTWEIKGFDPERLNHHKHRQRECLAELKELDQKLMSHSSKIKLEGADIAESSQGSLERIRELLGDKPPVWVRIECHVKLKVMAKDQKRRAEAQQAKDSLELGQRIGAALRRLGCASEFDYGTRSTEAVKASGGCEVMMRVSRG